MVLMIDATKVRPGPPGGKLFQRTARIPQRTAPPVANTGPTFVPMPPRPDSARVLGQATAWCLSWYAVFLILTAGFDAPVRLLARLAPVLLGVFVVVVTNNAVLLPRLYLRDRRLGYALGAVALVLGVALLLQYGWMADRGFPVQLGRGGGRLRGGLLLATLRHLLPLSTSLLGASLIEVTRYAADRERVAALARQEQLATQLKYLRAQVNPHFLFNSLNNVYTLVLLQDERAAESLLRLSGMLRYMLYDTETRVPLGRELDYLRDYIALSRLKNSTSMDVSVRLDDTRPDLPVAPLLLLPLVENAFKHSGVGEEEGAVVDIELTTEGDSIQLRVTNSLPSLAGPQDGAGGIGLENLRQRLQLLYPGRHQLTTERTHREYRSALQLDLP